MALSHPGDMTMREEKAVLALRDAVEARDRWHRRAVEAQEALKQARRDIEALSWWQEHAVKYVDREEVLALLTRVEKGIRS